MSATQTIEEHLQVIRDLLGEVSLIEQAAAEIVARIGRGGGVYFFGNGGSAADSQHLAAELVGRFERDRTALRSVALTTDTSILTAVGNDFGFDRIFARQVEALCSADDVVVALSTSGSSPNVLRALEVAGRIGAYRVGMTSRGGGKMKDLCDLCITVPSDRTARVQEAHILIGHVLCDAVERAAPGDAGEV